MCLGDGVTVCLSYLYENIAKLESLMTLNILHLNSSFRTMSLLIPSSVSMVKFLGQNRECVPHPHTLIAHIPAQTYEGSVTSLCRLLPVTFEWSVVS